eukprot:TRINITY_DN2924_c0_g2_i1.p2 TRINITY_DN2924_c0_g2~~TRINITY_DN2924_c0_g2_i1.p2  ORF type:complete len:464 (+),score=253.51 TRINITY_DN2924_c0_g2_i1:51-1442(+)
MTVGGDVPMAVEEEPHPLEATVEAAIASDDRHALRQVINAAPEEADDVRGIKCVENAVFALTKLILVEKSMPELRQLLVELRPFFQCIAKSRTARIVRRLFESVSASGVGLTDQLELVESFLEWARTEKRAYLRQRLQTRQGELRFKLERYTEALSGITGLLREVRKLDDKQMLVDVHVLESRIYYALHNISKAKAGLVAARTAAHTIYVSPLTQAEIDMQSGVIGAEEKDFKTAFSYFYEAFESFHGTGEHKQQAEQALKYMLMCKILDGRIADLSQVFQQKNILLYRDLRAVHAMKAIADAHTTRDLHEFNEVRKSYADVFQNDEIAGTHLEDLYNQLLEQHLLRVVEPYERVEIAHLAKLINLDAGVVEGKLSQMILDEKLKGILDQAHHCLIVYPEDHTDNLYPEALQTVEGLHKVVDALFDKCAGKFLPKKEEKKDDEKKDDEKKDDEKKDEKEEKKK